MYKMYIVFFKNHEIEYKTCCFVRGVVPLKELFLYRIGLRKTVILPETVQCKYIMSNTIILFYSNIIIIMNKSNQER